MNDNVITKFIELIGTWSAGAQIFGFLVLLFSIAFFMFKDFRTGLLSLFYALAGYSNDNPMKHPFFMQKALLLLQVDRVDFLDCHKTWLFKSLLTIKINISYLLVEEFIKSKVWVKQNKYELQTSLLVLVNNIIGKYETDIEQAYINKYKSSGTRLYNLVYNSEKGFKNYHKRNVEHIQQNISKIFSVDGFSNKEIINSFVLQIWVALDTAINDCYITFKGLNGDVAKEIEKSQLN